MTRQYNLSMFRNLRYIYMLPIALLLLIGMYFLPPVHSRLSWRLDDLRTRIVYFFKPPDQAVFQPEQQADFESILATTRAEYVQTLTPEATLSLSEITTPETGPTPLPTVTPTPLPATVNLKGVKYEDQHNRWNYCGPANFSMALTFWGWNGNRDVIGKAIKPSDKDKNVMPYELQDFVTDYVPGMSTAMRYGGDIDTLRRLIAAGYPVVTEKGYYELDYTGKMGWMGHYQFITGYDDTKRVVIAQDTYLDGPNFPISYDDFMGGWRAFNYLFVVVYPAEREGEVMGLLGPLANADDAARVSLERAQAEGQSLSGIDQFFAWFNVGTSHVALREYGDASYAYDYAFQLYNGLTGDNSIRPYRMMWYQTGPYFAYFYSNRFSDVINLATTTLEDTISEPVLEESLVWRGRAYYMSGQTQKAINDYRAALKVHPNWQPAVQALQDLGVSP
jgi:Peptidase_C39 like family/Tetratricopeptide repeat